MSLFSLGASPVRDERLVLAGLAVTAVAVVASMVPVLRWFRDSSEIKAIEPKTQYITHETEDALPLSTLESLVGHYNCSIRVTAAKIVFDRAINDKEVLWALLWGVARPDYNERMKHLQMLSMVADQSNLHLFNTPVAYAAFTRSLEHCLGAVEHEALVDWFVDEYPLRDTAEKMCLMFLGNLVCKYGVDGLVNARFVQFWLAKQPWVTEEQVLDETAIDYEQYLLDNDISDPGSSLSESGWQQHEEWVRARLVRRNFAQYLRRRENRITEICLRLQKSRTGRAALVMAGLLDRPVEHEHEDHDQHTHWHAPTRVWGQPNGLPAGQLPLPPASGIVLVNGPSMPAAHGQDGGGAAATASAEEGGDDELGADELPLGEVEADDEEEEDEDEDEEEEEDDEDDEDEEDEEDEDDEEDDQDDDDDDEDGDDEQGVTVPTGRESAAAAAARQAQQLRQARPPSQNSQEEQRIRRQHREAMVLNDGTRPLRRGDIIERESEH